MTRPLSIFLDVTAKIDVVRDAVANFIGHPLSQVEHDMGVIYKTTALYVEWQLYGDHGLEDNLGIEFSEYTYQLELIPFQAGMALAEFDAMYKACALFVASKLSTLFACRTLVVENLQEKLAVFNRPI